jgi:hypothetical protein
MGAKLVVICDSPEPEKHYVQRFSRSENRRSVVTNIMTQLRGLLGGVRRGQVRVAIHSAFASQTVNCDQSDTVDGTDTLTIGTITLSVEAAPANESEFLKGASDITMADNLAACINAHSILSLFVRAESDGVSDVTITSLYPGPVGDAITLAEAGNGFTLTGAALDGGDQSVDEMQSFAFGYSV